MCNVLVSIKLPHDILAVDNVDFSILGYSSHQLVGKSFAEFQGAATDIDLLHLAIANSSDLQSDNRIHILLYSCSGQISSFFISCRPYSKHGSNCCLLSLFPNSDACLFHPIVGGVDFPSERAPGMREQPLQRQTHAHPQQRRPSAIPVGATAVDIPARQRRRGARPLPPPLIVDEGYIRRLRRRLRADARRTAAAAQLAPPASPAPSASDWRAQIACKGGRLSGTGDSIATAAATATTSLADNAPLQCVATTHHIGAATRKDLGALHALDLDWLGRPGVVAADELDGACGPAPDDGWQVWTPPHRTAGGPAAAAAAAAAAADDWLDSVWA